MTTEVTTAGRAAAEALMQDRCTVKRPTGYSSQNETTGLEEATYTTQASQVSCKVSGKSSASADATVRTVNIGGVERVVIEAGIHLPVTSLSIQADDRIEITALGPLTDPELAGKVFQVVGFSGKSWGTARRLDVVEV